MIVLDTHALVWWVNGDSALSKSAEEIIQAEQADDGEILISTISAWEIAMLIEKGRLAISLELGEWLALV